jgi:K+-sensing histidine kinase KdpD
VYRNGEFGPLYEKITLASLVSTIAVNFIHAMYPPTQGHPFFFNGSKEFLVIGSVLIMVFVAAYSLNKAKESREQILTQVKSLDWYGTLINLVSHNLRSPLATIMSNAQILELKHPELKDTKEFERTLTSVEATTTILNRLMKATLLNEGAVNQSIVQTLERSYPQVEFIGKSCEKLSYEESISILLALEVFIDNALKYSSDKVKVEFNHDGICIRDFGPGIDGEKLARFGDLQEHSVGTLHGMGIPFAARILDSIGYKIHASNENPGLQVILAKVE